MSAVPESTRSHARLRRPLDDVPDLSDPSGLEDVERTMDRLIGGRDHAGRMAREHVAAGGKRLRARLALTAAGALGASRKDAVAWAAAVELLHNATLIHDDIQDGDRTRRGKPTLWTIHGRAQAINAGDMMLMLPYLAIAECGSHANGELCRVMAERAVVTVRGQIAELDMLTSESLDWSHYLNAIEGKTGALLSLPVHGAALLAGRSVRQAEALGNAFMPLGVLFQLQDDLLDLYGDKGRGRRGCDLYEGKVSALVVAHLARCPDDRPWLLQLLRAPRDETSPDEVDRAIDVFRESGAVHDVIGLIQDLADRARHDDALSAEPALRTLATRLSRLALAPIQHLFDDRPTGAEDQALMRQGATP
jgi:geranylgeranyl diphosphate synthase type I